MTTRITRREFIEQTTATVAVVSALGADAAAPQKIPHRDFGRNGIKVPILAFGCGSRFLAYKDEEQALRILSEAIDSGIVYLDTAAAYGNGESERRVGKVMATRRKDVVLATKIPENARSRDAALRAFEESLKRLQTDRVDVVHLHSLKEADDLAAIEAADGALKALYQIRDQKMARFIGMTSHTNGAIMAQAIGRHDLNAVQMAMNPSRALQFEELALPAANKKGLGIICMKVAAQDKLLGGAPGTAPMSSLIRYAWSLPVSTAVVGMPKPEFIKENLAAARSFTPLSKQEIDHLVRQVAPSQARLETFFANHFDV
jgi:predicted aldo/keto reductase-like oxidoreductase